MLASYETVPKTAHDNPVGAALSTAQVIAPFLLVLYKFLCLKQGIARLPRCLTVEVTPRFDLLRMAVMPYREMGLQIALDDLGAGFSCLRLWSELRP